MGKRAEEWFNEVEDPLFREALLVNLASRAGMQKQTTWSSLSSAISNCIHWSSCIVPPPAEYYNHSIQPKFGSRPAAGAMRNQWAKAAAFVESDGRVVRGSGTSAITIKQPQCVFNYIEKVADSILREVLIERFDSIYKAAGITRTDQLGPKSSSFLHAIQWMYDRREMREHSTEFKLIKEAFVNNKIEMIPDDV